MKKQIECAHQNIRMSRRVFFSSAHFYKQKTWSEAKNLEVFGKCFSKYGHGHNYILEAFFEGPINKQTGLLANLIDVDPILRDLTDELDHQHLNFNHPYFKDLVPTTENIASYLWQELHMKLKNSKLKTLGLYKLRLYEDPDLWVEIRV